MEKEKSKNSSVLVVAFFLLVLLLGGYILYDKVLSDKATDLTNNDNANNQSILDNNNNVENQQSNETNETNLFTKLLGTYSYKGKYVDSKEEIPENITFEETVYNELILNSSGEAEAKAGSVRGSGSTAKGKWYISNDKIIILNEKCTPSILNGEVEYVNCQPTWTYTYKIEDNKVIISSNSNLTKGETLVKE